MDLRGNAGGCIGSKVDGPRIGADRQSHLREVLPSMRGVSPSAGATSLLAKLHLLPCDERNATEQLRRRTLWRPKRPASRPHHFLWLKDLPPQHPMFVAPADDRPREKGLLRKGSKPLRIADVTLGIPYYCTYL